MVDARTARLRKIGEVITIIRNNKKLDDRAMVMKISLDIGCSDRTAKGYLQTARAMNKR